MLLHLQESEAPTAPSLQPPGAGTAETPETSPSYRPSTGATRVGTGCTTHLITLPVRDKPSSAPALGLQSHGKGTDASSRSSPSLSQRLHLSWGHQIPPPTPETTREELLNHRAEAMAAWQEKELGSGGAREAPEGAGREQGRDIFIPWELSVAAGGAASRCPRSRGRWHSTSAGEVN